MSLSTPARAQGDWIDILTRIIDIVLIVGMACLIFAMALAGWIAGLRRGESVTLLSEQGSRTSNLALQIGVGIVLLGVCAALAYLLWIPIPIASSSYQVAITPK